MPALMSITFSIPRHTTRYRSAGSVHNPVMIFVHGWFGTGLMWRVQVESFATPWGTGISENVI